MQGRVVARGLRADEITKGEVAIGYLDVGDRVGVSGVGDIEYLEEHTGGRTALVELAGRVQVPRPDRECGGDLQPVADHDPCRLEALEVERRGIDKRLHRHIVAGPDRRERIGNARERQIRYAVLENLCRGALGRLDVGLVERVDTQQRARKRDRDLPPHDLRAEPGASTVDRRGPEVDQRPPRRRIAVGAIGDEEAVGAVRAGRARRFPYDRQDPGAVLACRFRDELLHPVAERAPTVKGQLVATGSHSRSQCRGQGERGAAFFGALLDHLRRAAQDRREVEPENRGRHHAEM